MYHLSTVSGQQPNLIAREFLHYSFQFLQQKEHSHNELPFSQAKMSQDRNEPNVCQMYLWKQYCQLCFPLTSLTVSKVALSITAG